MNPLVVDALGSVLRWALTFLAGWFVEKGIWTQDNATMYVAAAATALLTLGWSLYRKYTTRQKIVTALASPTMMTEHQLEAQIATGNAAPVTTPKSEVAA